MTYTTYNLNGEILSIIYCPQKEAEEYAKTHNVFVFPGVFSGNLYYFLNNEPIKRQENPAVIYGNKIENIPNGIIMCGELGQFEVTDGTFDFTIDTPGTYEITVRSFPYKDKTFTVTV